MIASKETGRGVLGNKIVKPGNGDTIRIGGLGKPGVEILTALNILAVQYVCKKMTAATLEHYPPARNGFPTALGEHSQSGGPPIPRQQVCLHSWPKVWQFCGSFGSVLGSSSTVLSTRGTVSVTFFTSL